MTSVTSVTQTTQTPLRGNREFRLLWIGQGLSEFGSSMTGLALPLVLLAAGYPPSVVGLLGTVIIVVNLAFRVPGGYLADHFDQRRLMVICDVVRLVSVAAVAVCVFLGPLPLALALAVVVVSGAAVEVFRPSQAKVLRRVVPVDQLTQAFSLNQARAYGASIVAPAAAGVLFAVASWVPFAIDTVTFGLSLLCIVMLARERVHDVQLTRTTRERFLPEFVAGWRHLVKDRFLRTSSVYFSLLNVTFSALSYALVLGAASQPGGAATVGVAMSSAAAAGLIGSLIAPAVSRRLSLRTLLAAGPIISAALLAVAWSGAGVIPFVAAFSALCLLTPIIGAMLATIMAKAVPEEIYGRVTAAVTFVSQALQPFGPLAAGILLTHMSFGATAGLFAVTLGALALLALALPTSG
ncbi:MFS transporter [Kibdelosporangium aridum]|uniref:MFS transporter n=1 Tax=Kibdelosporangium aridum TaxID=2030 RepID=A0A428Z0R6_KIBAR|nr:MFS transporter [Kibdelosporangium aridum]